MDRVKPHRVEWHVPREALEHLAEYDEQMKRLINSGVEIKRERIIDPFVALADSIISQQVSMKAAHTVWGRFVDLVHEPTPETVLRRDVEELKGCGLSYRKVGYLRDLAQGVIDGTVRLDQLSELPDDEVVKTLVQIRGIGQWTAEMFLIFCLGRIDIVSYKDLGIRRGMKLLYGLDDEPTSQQFEQYRQRYQPYGTIASFYLWEVAIAGDLNSLLAVSKHFHDPTV